jgi:hypothetical protein
MPTPPLPDWALDTPDAVLVPLLARDGTLRAVAVVDAPDGPAVLAHTWRLHSGGYAVRGGGTTKVRLHRDLCGLTKGDGLEVDHRDGNRLDNRRRNMLVCTHAENTANVPARGATSRYRGVSWDAARGRWTARVQAGGKAVSLGRFGSELEAAQAAVSARAALYPAVNEARHPVPRHRMSA